MYRRRTKYYQHENQDTLVLAADELGEIIAALEAENRIFVDNHEIYQI
jgi:precorrin isomerase